MNINFHAQTYKPYLHSLFSICHLIGNIGVSVVHKLTDLLHMHKNMSMQQPKSHIHHRLVVITLRTTT